MTIDLVDFVRCPTGYEVTWDDFTPMEAPDVTDKTFFEGVKTGVWAVWKHFVATLVHSLRMAKWKFSANVCGALAIEFFPCLKNVYNESFDTKEQYTEFGVNPTELSSDFAKKAAILLLHGKDGNQAQMRALARHIAQKPVLGPVFTVNLNGGEMTMDDKDIVEKKLQEIEALYHVKGQPFRFDVVGYSRGAELAHYLALPKDSWKIENGFCNYKTASFSVWRPEFRKMIRIGSVLLEKEKSPLADDMLSQIYELTGWDDILMPQSSLLKEGHQLHVESGHVGLMQCEECFQWVVEKLS